MMDSLVRPAKILHTADIHLGIDGTDAGGVEERAFSRTIDLAIEANVDAILIAGDLFDHARVSEELLAWTARELDRAERTVVLLVGNHDSLNGSSVHHRLRVGERCANVALLGAPDGMLVEVPGTDVVVWGRAMIEHQRSFRPLAGVPEKPEGRWAVIAAHGLVLRDDRPSHHASAMRPSELEVIDWDYVALGHHHGHLVVRDVPRPVVYPGATARSLRGRPGVVLVDFSPDSGTRFEWTKLALS